MATVAETIRRPQIRHTECFINGKWVPARRANRSPPSTPRRKNRLPTWPRGMRSMWMRRSRPPAMLSRTARGAGWTLRDRGRLIHRLADLIEEELDELAALESLDNGKPIRDAKAADLPLVIDCLRYYAGFADKIHGQTIPVRGNFFTLHAQRAGRRGGASHPLELPDADGGLEVGAGAGGRLHHRHETRRANAADVLAHGGLAQEGGHSRTGSSMSCPASVRPRAPLSSSIPRWTRWRSPASTTRRKSSCATRRRR